MGKPIKIAVTKIRCLLETDEVGADEPYVLVVGADLKKTPPNVEATLYGPWGDVDTGELKETITIDPNWPPSVVEAFGAINLLRRPFWGLDNKTAQSISKPEDVIFIASVMEHDDGDPKTCRLLVKTAVIGSLLGSMGMDRATRVQKAIEDVHSALGTPTGAPNFDDRVGTKELKLTSKDLSNADAGTVAKNLLFTGDGGQYRVRFELSPG
jgi:hypothetical protein